MSVVAEFMIPADAFAFGNALRTEPPMKVLLDRIVPGEGESFLYVWVSSGDFDSFEDQASRTSSVLELAELDDHGERRLYRVRWQPGRPDLIRAIEGAEGVILQASGAGTWTFQLRFPDHDHLSSFYATVTEQDISLNVDNVQILAEQPTDSGDFELTMEQREALTLAVRRGYYEVPRDTQLSVIADELGVSNQAASERIRRGSARLLRPILLGEE